MTLRISLLQTYVSCHLSIKYQFLPIGCHILSCSYQGKLWNDSDTLLTDRRSMSTNMLSETNIFGDFATVII